MLIKLILLAGVVGFLVLFVRGQNTVHMQAGKRLAFVVFLILNVYAILRPDEVTLVAHLVGVGRGTDLVLYLLVMMFVFIVINFYLRLRDTQRSITELARATAINEAERINAERGLLPPADLGSP